MTGTHSKQRRWRFLYNLTQSLSALLIIGGMLLLYFGENGQVSQRIEQNAREIAELSAALQAAETAEHLLEEGRWQESVLHYRKAAAIYETLPEKEYIQGLLHAVIGSILESEGLFGQAQAEFEKATVIFNTLPGREKEASESRSAANWCKLYNGILRAAARRSRCESRKAHPVAEAAERHQILRKSDLEVIRIEDYLDP